MGLLQSRGNPIILVFGILIFYDTPQRNNICGIVSGSYI